MIRNAMLLSLFASCDDSTWLGQVCRALGGQDVSLDEGQKQVVRFIMQDGGRSVKYDKARELLGVAQNK